MGRQNRKEARQFINIAMGSLRETEYLLEFCLKLDYLSSNDYEHLEGIRDNAGALLWGLYNSF